MKSSGTPEGGLDEVCRVVSSMLNRPTEGFGQIAEGNLPATWTHLLMRHLGWLSPRFLTAPASSRRSLQSWFAVV